MRLAGTVSAASEIGPDGPVVVAPRRSLSIFAAAVVVIVVPAETQDRSETVVLEARGLRL